MISKIHQLLKGFKIDAFGLRFVEFVGFAEDSSFVIWRPIWMVKNNTAFSKEGFDSCRFGFSEFSLYVNCFSQSVDSYRMFIKPSRFSKHDGKLFTER